VVSKIRQQDPGYLRYDAQCQRMQRVLALYETEPDNFPRIMELMQDMQEHGQVSCDCLLVLILLTMISSDSCSIDSCTGSSNDGVEALLLYIVCTLHRLDRAV
jgi:hypothetical protein